MLIFEAFHLLRRTAGALKSDRRVDAAATAAPLARRTGMFSTPVAAGMLTGIIGSAINILPFCCFNWNYSTYPGRILLMCMIGLNVICSGPVLVYGSLRGARRTIYFAVLITLLTAFIPFMAMTVRNFSFWYYYYEINAASRLLTAALIGRHLARRYGLKRKVGWCALLATLGNLPAVGFDGYCAWLFKTHPQADFAISKDLLAFMVMLHLVSAVGIAMLPALVVESEFRRDAAERAAQPADSAAGFDAN